jgi:mitogen-activated protein kinase 7
MKKVPWKQLYPKSSPEAQDLLEKLLAFDPAQRITVEEALAHPYLEAYHDIEDEPDCPAQFDFAFEVVESIADMKGIKKSNSLVMIAKEVVDYKAKQSSLLPNALPKPKEALAVPSREQVGHIEEEESGADGAMDIDEELRMREN